MEELTQIGAREARAMFASLVRRANSGERIVITVDGQPQAMLGPVDASSETSMESLFAAGLANPPKTTQRSEAPQPTPLAADVRVNAILATIRAGQ